MQWPNGRTDVRGFSPYTVSGASGQTLYSGDSATDKAPFTSQGWSKGASRPVGYAPDGAYSLPLVTGEMTSWQSVFGFSTSASMLSGSTLQGGATLQLSGAGQMALIVSMAGNGNVSITGSGGLSLTIGLAGNGDIVFTGSGGLSLRIPMEGAGNFGISGAGDLRGRLAMAGSWGGATPLSPEALAAAVWGALASANNSAGTMGALVNASGAGGDPWAVTLEGTYTAADLVRLIASHAAGPATGLESDNPKFKSLDGAKVRIDGTYTAGNRTIDALDATP